MEETYDVIILGTGLKECILSGVFSVEGKKVLHMDRNQYYGSESASLNLNQLYEKFQRGTPKDTLGASRDYNIDLVPKFIMSCGALVDILVKTGVTKYLEFKSVDGSFVQSEGKVHKVPSTGSEALNSALMGFFEKMRCKKFLEYVGNYELADPKTHSGHNLKTETTESLFKSFSLSAETITFVGHAMALHQDDSYLKRPALDTVERISNYAQSVLRYGNSPYIYPLYGLGELPQAFARLSAVYGGTYMLNKNADQIIYENGVVVGVKSGDEIAKAPLVIGDPSYFPDKVKKVGQVVNCITILNHPIPNTNNAESAQIIIPQKELKRKYDVYVCTVSAAHKVAPKGKWIAEISTIVETDKPQQELAQAINLLGGAEETFYSVRDLFEPVGDGKKDRVFITKSYDPETHFNLSCEDILDIYKRITGKDMDLTPPKTEEGAEQ